MRNAIAAQILFVWLLTGCGNVFVGFVSNPQFPSSTSGKITAVDLGLAHDINGIPLTITTVTLVNDGLASTSNFCGDQRSHFPADQIVRVDFVQETGCLFLVNVVILG